MEAKFYSAFHWMQLIVIMDSFYTSIHFNTNGTQQCCQHTCQLQCAFTSSTVYCKEKVHTLIQISVLIQILSKDTPSECAGNPSIVIG